MKTTHHPGVHFHLGPIEFDLDPWVIPVSTLVLLIVTAYLVFNPDWGVAGFGLTDANMAP